MPKRRGFFDQQVRPEDEAARLREVEALISPRRTFPQEIAVDLIQSNPFQARQTFDALDELAEAIRAQGFTSRLRVRAHPNEPQRFQLVYGERRLRAARLAGLDTIPCDVANHSDEEMIEIGLAENIQRRDLDPLEEGRAFQTFIDERGYSIRKLAERIGKEKSYIEDRLTLLRAPADVLAMIERRPDTLRSAREIAKLPSVEQRQPLIADVVEGRITTSQVRELVRSGEAAQPPHMPRAGASEKRDVRRTLEQDRHAIAAILARWRSLLEQGETEQQLVSEALEQLLLEAQQLGDTIVR